ncbi:hypothetical protein [Methylobacterium oxalidis]|uniref:Uncharacterized protein n=1 Tax=Methylobacterium oxalidis TaxID=944322 RepID=A0A512J2B5_9HYPH|nr:hypothetical protein [Methylobacterium oxalidis]GEP04019.1 hypothetical protein MOX02_20570 [Methylobacterium oxalidis]GJE34857.1 hypothetical protein LDDCCGHA_5072 [Methylobacterium oxalidis]GLS64050.1 hypothetical protein GCM10007888_24310 [Methylobacterium oxalidis]
MNLIQRLNARLVGFRVYLLAVLFSLPDVLSALVGFDWNTVLPAGYEGYGTRIGGCLMLARLVLVPMLKSLRDAARGPDAGAR